MNLLNNPKSQHGGPRKGAGRKPKGPTKYQKFPLVLPPHQIEFLRNYKASTGLSMASFVVEALDKAIKDYADNR